MSLFEILTVAVSVVGAATGVIAVFFVGGQVRHATKQAQSAAAAQEHEWERQRRRATVDFFTFAADRNWKLKQAEPFLSRDSEKAREFIQQAYTDRKVELSIVAYFDFLDTLGVGVAQEVFDLKTLDMICGTRILAMFQNYAEYIAYKRQAIHPDVWRDLDHLVEAITTLRRNENRPIDPFAHLVDATRA